MIENDKQLLGCCGVFYACAELTMRGWVAVPTMRNIKIADILATKKNNQILIQVKTTLKREKSWVVGKKDTEWNKKLFYIFVKMREHNTPIYHIVPSEFVAHQISKTHKDWLKVKRRDGKSRKDTAMRIFEDKKNIWLENWAILEK